jgi:hypothetical protein
VESDGRTLCCRGDGGTGGLKQRLRSEAKAFANADELERVDVYSRFGADPNSCVNASILPLSSHSHSTSDDLSSDEKLDDRCSR